MTKIFSSTFATTSLSLMLLLSAPSFAQTSAVDELAFWNKVKESGNADDIKSYIDAFPNGMFVDPAALRYEQLSGKRIASLPEETVTPVETTAVPVVKPVIKKTSIKKRPAIRQKTIAKTATRKIVRKPVKAKAALCGTTSIYSKKCLTTVALKKKKKVIGPEAGGGGGSGGGNSGGGGGWN
jgi:hypothetical protein